MEYGCNQTRFMVCVCVAASHLYDIPVWQVLVFPVTGHQVRVAPTHKAMPIRVDSWKLHISTICNFSFTRPLSQIQCEPVHSSWSYICIAQPHAPSKAHVKLGAQADSTKGDFITVLLCRAEVKDL